MVSSKRYKTTLLSSEHSSSLHFTSLHLRPIPTNSFRITSLLTTLSHFTTLQFSQFHPSRSTLPWTPFSSPSTLLLSCKRSDQLFTIISVSHSTADFTHRVLSSLVPPSQRMVPSPCPPPPSLHHPLRKSNKSMASSRSSTTMTMHRPSRR